MACLPPGSSEPSIVPPAVLTVARDDLSWAADVRELSWPGTPVADAGATDSASIDNPALEAAEASVPPWIEAWHDSRGNIVILGALLAGRGVSVHAVLAGPVDTDMSRALDIPKASPESVARAIFDGVQNGEEDIFPDAMSASMAEDWRTGAAKALERQYAGLVAGAPAP